MKFIPSPPDLKPTIIQMQNVDQSDESIDPKCIPKQDQEQPTQQPKRKRRRSSSSLVSQNEIEKRRREHKTAHSIIEKKRRIRMNREFEALKYLIPACRNNLGNNGNGGSGNNGEGMYKLTILQATVDYIRYLHQVINIQQDEIMDQLQVGDDQQFNEFDGFNDFDEDDEDNNNKNLDFAKIDIDTDSYRNLDLEFDFNKLFSDLNKDGNSNGSSSRQQSTSSRRKGKDLSIMKQRSRFPTSTTPTTTANIITNSDLKFQPLPSPLITPELFPKSGISSNTTPIANYKTINPDFQFKPIPNPTTKRDFQLPKPAISNRSSSSSSSSFNSETKLTIINELQGPRDIEFDHDDNSASNALMAMKRDSCVASIRSLLN